MEQTPGSELIIVAVVLLIAGYAAFLTIPTRDSLTRRINLRTIVLFILILTIATLILKFLYHVSL